MRSRLCFGLCLLVALGSSCSRKSESITSQPTPAPVSIVSSSAVESGNKAERIEAGLKYYGSACAACHQANGEGIPTVYPPLAGSEWVNESETRAIAIVICGLTGPIAVKGASYPGIPMPAFGDSGTFQWTDEQIAAVLTYVRQAWGNQATAVSAAQVAAVRAKLGKRSEMTEQELRQLP